MAMRGFDAVVLLAVGRVGFAAGGVVHAGLRHQVAFIGRVDEHAARIAAAVFHDDGGDALAGLDDAFAGAQIEARLHDDGDLVLCEHLLIDRGSDVGLEGPHGVVGGVDLGVAEFVVTLARLIFPGFGLLVMLLDAAIEFAGDAADHLLVADVGPAQAAGGESAEMRAGVDDDGRLAHTNYLDGGGDSGGRRAVDDDVSLTGLRAGEQGEEQQQVRGSHDLKFRSKLVHTKML